MRKNIQYNEPFLKEVSEHLFQILDQSQNGITITNPNQNDNPIIFANKAFCNTFGYSLDEIINKNCRFLHKDDTEQEEINDIRKAISNKKSISTILRNYKKDGTLVFIELSISPIFDEDKNLKYFLGIQKDITKEKKFVEQMRISQNLANIGSWELNILTNELYWSDEIFNLFEIDKNNFSPSYEAFLNVIHPKDRELVNDAYLKSLKTKEKYSIQHRLLMNDGRIKYVEEKCISYFDKNGNPIKSVGTVQDISDIKKIEIELQKILSFFESHKLAMDKSSIVSKSNLKGLITYVNDNFCKISGFSKEEVIGKPHNIIRHPDNPNELFEDLWNTIKNKNVWKKTLRNRDKFGKEYWVDTSILPILDENDNIVEYIAVRHDVTKMIEQQIELDNIANTDILTGLGNRYKLLNDIKNSFNPALAILNIDNFSQINDFYGHEIGDIVIKEFATKIKNEIISEKRNIYHLQGDEYVIFDSDADKNEFIEKIINLSKKLEKNKIVIKDDYLTFNFTVAISFENKNSLLKTADMALKSQKIVIKNL
jgi:PAS domain S-box-containing protein/diguanylate cyclase (GGDEF)-like protein